ncbi:hypothetical protein TIFTF001_021260 [Ficus carica]|uniref:Uncharacterized protein n=1 Tax=Ficus carica TaxID=3494 RepID=A0AA88DJR9_FICCA|nr:hypothetical protein TIFTF001_021260 [Ficus carica]
MAEGLGGTGNRGTDKQQMGKGGEEHEVGEQWTKYGETDNRAGWEHGKLSLVYCTMVQREVGNEIKS